MKIRARILALFSAALILAATGGAARAAGESSPPAPGTRITMQNWEQYKDYLPEGIQALFSGKYSWKLPPDAELDVSPTVNHPLPPPYIQATEKYSSQVQLVRLPNGGLGIRNYVAGMPFPNPAEPHKGWKILANMWFRYIPHLIAGIEPGLETVCGIDSYAHTICDSELAVYRQLRHSVDPGVKDISDSQGASFLEFWRVEAPENHKYEAGLTLYYDDRPEDDYLFLPNLRRTLRINAAARCSPAAPTDFTEDDWRYGFSGYISDFGATFIGDKKILAMVNYGTEGGKMEPASYYMPLLWPRPAWANWELRDSQVIDIRTIQAHAQASCYGKRIMYVDANSQIPLWEDLYDDQMNLWKVFRTGSRAHEVPAMGVQDASGSRIGELWDLKHQHLSFLSSVSADGHDFVVNNQVPKQYDDVQKYGGLSGLNEILR
jgi:hypothetical protein